MKRKQERPDRPKYLSLLLDEYRKSTNQAAKYETLANLANFSYDPSNYKFLRDLQIVDVFLDNLEDNDPTIVGFSIAGLCNLSADPVNKHIINNLNGVEKISKLLDSTDDSIIASTLTTLIYLVEPSSAKGNFYELYLQVLPVSKTANVFYAINQALIKEFKILLIFSTMISTLECKRPNIFPDAALFASKSKSILLKCNVIEIEY